MLQTLTLNYNLIKGGGNCQRTAFGSNLAQLKTKQAASHRKFKLWECIAEAEACSPFSKNPFQSPGNNILIPCDIDDGSGPD